MIDAKSRSSALHSVNYLLEMFPQCATYDMFAKVSVLVEDREDSMYTVPDLIIFLKITQKILKNLKIDNPGENLDTVLDFVFNLDPLALKNSHSSFIRILKIAFQVKGEEFLRKSIPKDVDPILKRFLRAQRKANADKNASDADDGISQGMTSLSSKLSGMTKLTKGTKTSKISRKMARKMRENEAPSDDGDEIIDLLNHGTDRNVDNKIETAELDDQFEEKKVHFNRKDGKIIINDDPTQKKRSRTHEDSDDDEFGENFDNRSKSSRMTKQTKFTFGSEYKSRKGKGDIKPKGVDVDPYAYVKFDKSILTNKKKVVKGLYDDLFSKK